MRVAITLLVAFMTVAGPTAALANCSASSPASKGDPGPAKSIPEKVLDVLGLGGVTNITNTTTNITNNFFTTAEQTPQAAQTAPTTQTAATFAPGGGFGGGGGGGVGGMGGGFASSSGVGGPPINPSSETGGQMFAGGGGSSTGGGSSMVSDPITIGSFGTMGGNQGNLVMMASADQSGEQPLTPGIALSAVPAPHQPGDDSMTVALASPKTEKAGALDAVRFEGEASASTPHAPGTANTTMLAALIGVGMLGAGWAWRSLGV